MRTTKRTTANFALDVNGEKIRLLVTRARESYRFGNVLTYEKIRKAVQKKLNTVTIENRFGDIISVNFGLLDDTGTVAYDSVTGNESYVNGPIYRIGCHYFTLKMFNRILRAAGIRTTKASTQKRFSAAAGQ